MENFDVPGEDEFGQTFYEKTETSNSACVEGSDSKCSNHREGTGVDLKEAASGVAIGWFQTDEWLEYSVYAEKAGDYTLYVAAVSEMGGTLKFTIKDAAGNLVSETGDIVVGESGGFNDSEYGKTEGVAVKLAEGVNVIRMTCTKEYLDVDYFNLVEGVNAADNALIGQEVPPTYISVAEVEAKENSSSSSSSEELQAGTSSSGKTEKTEAIFADRINMFSNTLLDYDVFDMQGHFIGRMSAYGMAQAVKTLKNSSMIKNQGVYFIRSRSEGFIKQVQIIKK